MRYRLQPPMSLDEFSETLGEMLDEIPEPLLEDLNGGVLAEPGAKHDEDHPGLLILGQYHRDPYLGNMVVLYYGSFCYLFGSNRAVWEREMRRTLRHEIRHHVEHRAGLRDLEKEDRERVRRYLAGEPGEE